MQEGDDLLDLINKVKISTDRLTCREVPIRNEDIVMTLLESLSPSYEHLIIVLETIHMNEPTIEYVTTRLINEISKKNEKESQGNNGATMLHQGKWDNPSLTNA